MHAESGLDAKLFRKWSTGISGHESELLRKTESDDGKPDAEYELLLRWGVVSAAGTHAKILAIVGHNFDGAVVAVRLEVARLVGDGVLAAQLVLDFGKIGGHVADLEGKKCPPSGGVGDALQNLVALAFDAADVGADGVDDGLGALRHFDCVFAGHVAQVVLAIAQQNDGAPRGRGPRGFQELVAAGKINGIEHGRAAA